MKKAILAVMVVALVLGAASIAGAASDTVNVSAQANGKLTMTLDNNSVNFAAVDPGTPVTQLGAVDVTVSSNKAFATTKTITENLNGNGAMGLTTSGFVVAAATPRGDYPWVEDYSINIPWATTADVPLTASVLYTAIQN